MDQQYENQHFNRPREQRLGPDETVAGLDRNGFAVPRVEAHEELSRTETEAIYRARRVVDGRPVTVIVARGTGTDATQESCFRKGAEALCRIRHSNIATCYDVGRTDDGDCFVVLEDAEGETLAAYVNERGPLPDRQALRIVRDLAGGLEAAERAGLHHGDLRPENVILHPGITGPYVDPGFPLLPRLTGFDLFAFTRKGARHSSRTENGHATDHAWEAPEGHGTREADVYGLGALLWFMLTAGAPAADMHGSSPGDPREINPTISNHTTGFLARLMSRTASDRPTSYREIALEADRLSHTVGEDYLTLQKRQSRIRLVAFAVGLSIVAFLELAYLLSTKVDDGQPFTPLTRALEETGQVDMADRSEGLEASQVRDAREMPSTLLRASGAADDVRTAGFEATRAHTLQNDDIFFVKDSATGTDL